MRRYRKGPLRSDDWDVFFEPSNPNTSIDVSLPENPWEPIRGPGGETLLFPDGTPVQAYTGPERAGFIWTQDEDDED
jgi:hypothetical protein